MVCVDCHGENAFARGDLVMDEIPRTMVVLIEWRPKLGRVTVRGVWPEDEWDFRKHPILEDGNLQNAVRVFEGVDMKSHVGFLMDKHL